jgi:hypothetical protein
MSCSAQAVELILDVTLVELVPDVYGRGAQLSLDEWRLAFAYIVTGRKGRQSVLLQRQDLRHCDAGRPDGDPTNGLQLG